MKFVIYRRVSTTRQFNSQLGLLAQSESVRRYLATQPDAEVLADLVEAESGKNDDRPVLRQAVELCRKHSAKIIVSRIDRLSRSLRLIMMLEQYKVPFVAADNPEMTELVCHIMVAIGSAERKTIATRVRDALRQAKLRGVKLGGPNIAEARLLANTARIQKAKEQNDKLRKVVQEIMEKTGLTKLADIAQALNLRGLRTSRGCRNELVQCRIEGHGRNRKQPSTARQQIEVTMEQVIFQRPETDSRCEAWILWSNGDVTVLMVPIEADDVTLTVAVARDIDGDGVFHQAENYWLNDDDGAKRHNF